MVLQFELSVLPYLLRLFTRSYPSGRPRSVGPSRLRLRQLEKRCKQRFGASPVRDVGQSQKRRWPGLPVREAGRSRKRALSFPWLGLSVREAGRSRMRAPFLFGQAFRSERWAGVGSERCPFLAFRSERRARVESERRSFLARPSGRRGGPGSEASTVPPWPGLSVGEVGWSQRRASALLG